LTIAASTHPTYGNLVDGSFEGADETFLDTNPAALDDVVGVFPRSAAADAAAAVGAAEAAAPGWRATPTVARGKLLLALARSLRSREEEVVAAITREQGKPLAESRGELSKTIEYFEYYGALAYEHGGRLLPSARPGVEISVRREPVGVSALITPWNVPLAIPARKVAPALVCGNTLVLKPARETPLSAHVLAEAALEVGVPAGVLNVVHGDGLVVGEALARDPRVRAISFTGSTPVGRRLASIAAERLARIQLELGGKNAAVVLDDADLPHAVAQIAAAAYTTTGQQCTATSRVLVQRRVLDRFTELLAERVRALRVGPGTDEGASVGPLVSERHLESVLEYVRVGREEGAELVAGGSRLQEEPLARGCFMEPTLFAGVRPEMRIAREEIFGPVLAVLAVEDDDEALAVANDSEYGLSTAVYTSSLSRSHRFVDELEAGAVAVNLPSAGWEVQTPFGGFKASGGYGSKEQGVEGLEFFCELKAVQVLALP
jgi:acyl-CoA reductase-like NAD-dependent aldehyde dehydrogenase